MPRIVKIVLAVLVGVPVVGLVASYCSASLQHQRVSGNEASAIGSMRAIVSAQMVHFSECGGYSPTLAGLAASGYLLPDLGSDPARKSGYEVALVRPAGAQDVTARKPACGPTISAFNATAVPVEPGTTGLRFFMTDDSGQVKQATSATFTDARLLE